MMPGPLRSLGVAVLLLVAVGSPQHYQDGIITANESARVFAAQAIVSYGTLDLAPVFDDYFPGWRAGGRPPNVDVSVKDGAYLLDKAPGVTLAAVPVVAVMEVTGPAAYRWRTWLLALLLAGVPSVGFILVFRRWGAPWSIAAATVLATPWLVYAGLLFGHAACAGLAGIGLLLSLGPLEHAPNTAGAARTARRDAFLGGLCLGGAVLVEYTAAVLVVSALLALALDPQRRHRLIWVIAGGVAPALISALWNTISFGAPWQLSYGFKADAAMAETHSRGVYGIAGPTREGLYGSLLSARRGLFFFAPWLLAGVVGAAWAAAASSVARAWRIVLPVGIAAFALMIGGFADWHGGRAFGPRYLVPVIPVLGIGVVALLRGAPSRRYLLAVIAGLIASSAALALVGAYGDAYSSRQLTNPTFEVNIPVLLHGGPLPTIWSTIMPRSVGFAIGVAALVIALVGRRPRIRDGALLPIVVAAAVAVLHLVAGTLPQTEGPAAVASVLRDRVLAHQLMGQPAAAAAVQRELDAFARSLQAP
ncbi:MAG: hypothetical protein M3680_08120 [Myxococcota bacterium]|nr:hypothetical protein [Myxococcota bacterium]